MLLPTDFIRADPFMKAVHKIVISKSNDGFITRAGFRLMMAQYFHLNKEQSRELILAAREAGCKILYLRHGYSPDLSDAGGENSPNWYKELALVLMRRQPEHKGKLLIRGAWDAEIVEDLCPQDGDIVLWKQRYSGFVGTNLDMILRTQNMKYLFFVGVATNVCVEASIRDAFYHEYFSILISDAVANAGPPTTQDATISNIRNFYGWVTTSRNVIEALR